MLVEEELLLALPPGHPLARKQRVTTGNLDALLRIVMEEGHCPGDQMLKFCDRQILRLQITFRSAQIETVQALVPAGLGVSLIPAMADVGGSQDRAGVSTFPESQDHAQNRRPMAKTRLSRPSRHSLPGDSD